MKNTILPLIPFLAIFSFCVITTAQDNAVLVDFESDIKPILESNCLRCHNEENAEGGYRLDSREDAMDYVEEGDSESSDLYLALISDEEDVMMPPPDEGGPLDDSDIKMIQTWIDEGATWPASVILHDPDAKPTDDTEESTEESSSPEKMPSGKSEKPTIPFAIGLLHPAAIHLPIGLLLGAGLFALLSIRGNFVMSDCAYYCLWLGTIGAIIACATGWWFALDQYPKEYIEVDQLVAGLQNMEHKLFWHRTSALIVTGFALLLCLYAASARNHDPDDGVSWKMGAIILAMGIGFVGHEGGELSWKESHYDEFWEVVDEYIPGVAAEKEVKDRDSTIDIDEAASGETSDDGAGPEDIST